MSGDSAPASRSRHENVGPVEIRWTTDGDPDDVVAPWPAERLSREKHQAYCASQRVSVHVERMGGKDIWMCISDELTGEDIHMWFKSKKAIHWTVRDHASASAVSPTGSAET